MEQTDLKAHPNEDIGEAARRLLGIVRDVAERRGDKAMLESIGGREDECVAAAIAAHERFMEKAKAARNGPSLWKRLRSLRAAAVAYAVVGVPVMVAFLTLYFTWVSAAASMPPEVASSTFWRTARTLSVAGISAILCITLAVLLADRISAFARSPFGRYACPIALVTALSIGAAIATRHEVRMDLRTIQLAFDQSKERLGHLALASIEVEKKTGSFPSFASPSRFGPLKIEKVSVTNGGVVYEATSTGLRGRIGLELQPGTAALWWGDARHRMELATLGLKGRSVILTDRTGHAREIGQVREAGISSISRGDKVRVVAPEERRSATNNAAVLSWVEPVANIVKVAH